VGCGSLAFFRDSCSTAHRIQFETDRSSASARSRTSASKVSGKRTGTGSLSCVADEPKALWEPDSLDLRRTRALLRRSGRAGAWESHGGGV